MKFGKSLRNEIAETLSRWESEFISYKQLKKLLKVVAQEPGEGDRSGEVIGFTELLDSELDKIVTFFIEKEEEYIIEIKELKERFATVESNSGRMQLRQDILELHLDIVLLFRYSVLNFTGLLKIVKKHKKKTGRVICLPYMPQALQQPLMKLMKECEAMLNE